MRFAFVVNNYPPRVGGVETHVHSLAGHLVARGHDVEVVTLSPDIGVSTEDRILVRRLAERLRVADVLGFPPLGSSRRLARHLRATGVDVVSIHTRFFPMSWVGLRAGRRAGAAVVHTEHGSDHVVSASVLIAAASRAVDVSLGRRILRSADQVLGVSEQVVAFVRRLAGRSAVVFYNAIEPPLPGTRTPRPDHLVFVGRLVAGKGWEVFVDVVASLVAGGHPVSAEMLGDGEDRGRLEELIRAGGLQDVISVRGRVSPDHVRMALAGATLVNPTTLAEGFQTTLLEALAEGGRVVTFPVPGAEVLRTEGHDVTIVAERTAAALTDALAQSSAASNRAAAPAAPPDLARWYWPGRAAEYERICAEVVERAGARRRAG